MHNGFGNTKQSFLSTIQSLKTDKLPVICKSRTIFAAKRSTLDQTSEQELLPHHSSFHEKRMSEYEKSLLPADLKPATLDWMRHNQQEISDGGL